MLGLLLICLALPSIASAQSGCEVDPLSCSTAREPSAGRFPATGRARSSAPASTTTVTPSTAGAQRVAPAAGTSKGKPRITRRQRGRTLRCALLPQGAGVQGLHEAGEAQGPLREGPAQAPRAPRRGPCGRGGRPGLPAAGDPQVGKMAQQPRPLHRHPGRPRHHRDGGSLPLRQPSRRQHREEPAATRLPAHQRRDARVLARQRLDGRQRHRCQHGERPQPLLEDRQHLGPAVLRRQQHAVRHRLRGARAGRERRLHRGHGRPVADPDRRLHPARRPLLRRRLPRQRQLRPAVLRLRRRPVLLRHLLAGRADDRPALEQRGRPRHRHPRRVDRVAR